jgi:hypothetical protein
MPKEKKMGWTIFWAIFSQTHLVTLVATFRKILAFVIKSSV